MAALYTPATLPENIKHKDTNKLVYSPSLQGVFERFKYNIKWWGDGAFFQHNALLISAFHGQKYWNFRDKYEIPKKDFTFIADSGGFQAFSMGVWSDPIDILRWEENNADIGMMLDVPPTFETGLGVTNEFKKHAKKSKINYEKMVKNRQNDEMELFMPIHGTIYESLKWWYKYCSDVHCDGFASSPRKSSPDLVAFTLGFAIEHQMHDFHLFLGSGKNVIPVIVYASKFLKNLSFDSSSFSQTGGRYRKYYLPGFSNETIGFGRNEDVKITELPCNCPVCTKINNPLILKKENATSSGMILLHNLYLTLQSIESLNSLIKDTNKFKEIISKYYPVETQIAINFIDEVIEKGFEDAYDNRRFSFMNLLDTDKVSKDGITLQLPADLTYWTQYKGNFRMKERANFIRNVLRREYEKDIKFKEMMKNKEIKTEKNTIKSINSFLE